MDALHREYLNLWRKILMPITQECWKQYPTKRYLYGPYQPSRKLSKLDETDMLNMLEKWGQTHMWQTLVNPFTWTSKGRTASRTYMKKLCADIEYRLEDLPGAIDDRNRWCESVRKF